MKKSLLTLAMLLVAYTANAQYYDYDWAVADIDMDGVADTVRVDRVEGAIVCRLSSKGFQPIKSVPTQSLVGERFIPNISLSARQGAFQLAFLGNRATSHFIFTYDKRRKDIYLSEHWAESLGDINGSEASNFQHDVLKGRVDYWITYYGGSMDPDEYEPDNYVTNTAKKRVAKMRIPLQEFSDRDYYQRTEYIWEEL